VPLAVTRAPDQPHPPSWKETTLPDFETHIQPIFDRYCISCHGSENPDAGLEFTSREIDGYHQSYRTLFGLKPDDATPVWEVWSRKLMVPEHQNPQQDKESLRMMEENRYPGQLISLSNRFSDNSVTRVREFGSTQSKLITAMLDGLHQEKAKLSEKDWIDLVTWVDLNAPYWGTFVNKEPARSDKEPQRIAVEFPAMFDSSAYKAKILFP
jgi:hypothetical protein